MRIYAVIDTNVIVSGLLTHDDDSATYLILKKLYNKELVPIYNEEILFEYYDVLTRSKFNFTKDVIIKLIRAILQYGIYILNKHINEKIIDEGDKVFYETLIGSNFENCFLITGNLKHFPSKDNILSPREFISYLNN